MTSIDSFHYLRRAVERHNEYALHRGSDPILWPMEVLRVLDAQQEPPRTYLRVVALREDGFEGELVYESLYSNERGHETLEWRERLS